MSAAFKVVATGFGAATRRDASHGGRTGFLLTLSPHRATFGVSASRVLAGADIRRRGGWWMSDASDPNSREAEQVPAKPVIVGIGASAGGIHALQAFFESLPTDTGAAYVVIVHLDPKARSELPSILAARTSMPVSQVVNPEQLQADHVYVIPPDRQLRLSDHEVSTAEFNEPRGRRAPIDLFFRSLAGQHGDGFAIILSGAGADGATGVKDVKEAGGIILVQDPAEAEYPSMPRSAIATGIADLVLPVRELAGRLVRLIRSKHATAFDGEREVDEELLRRLLAHVRVRTGHDFSKYKRSTVLRRITRRMQVTRTDDLKGYSDFLRENSEEAQALLGDLLISVTTFFRDHEAFEALKVHVIPRLFDAKSVGDTIRIWVPGCATGEEAYSIAIVVLEEAARHDIRPAVQVFGSDLDTRALALAREGSYPAAIEADVSEERLRRFFVHEGEHYRVRRELRDIVLFAAHSVLKDPPFSRIDLVSCRNLLIYLDRELQQQVCSTFHYALNPGGYLIVGSSETAENPPGLFVTLDRKSRIYRSSENAVDKPRLLPRLLGGLGTHEAYAAPGRPLSPSAALNEAAIHRQAIEQVAPPSVLVDTAHRVVHLSEHAGRFLQPSGGPMSGDLVDLARAELRFELRSALHRAFELGQSTLSLPILVRFNGTPQRVHFQVKPALDENDNRPRHAVVLFIEGEAIEQDAIVPDQRAASNETVRRLSEELQLTQARLRTTREESEAANEELRAANEELQSINEEYRSTSEELETSKEELQSINEELQTVNLELKLKLEAVSRGHSDLQNLMAATDVGILFLDANLRIKRFTVPVTELFHITPSDEGRPVTDFAHQLVYDDLVKDAGAVLKNLAPIRREVRSRDDRWHDMRLRPYRTVDDKIDGVVITFVDISDRKAWELRQQLLLGELSHRIKNTLAVVQSIAHQTQRYSASPADFIASFDGRLRALGSAHSLLVESDWRGADLGALARDQLGAYASDRVRIDGEPVVLPADLATPFGLVLHELATNAAKHGALSGPAGIVNLRWNLESRNNQRMLTVFWTERGGPPVQRPTKSGLGGTLIERSVPHATVRREFRPEGLACTIEIPLEETVDSGRAAQGS
jgi:two-component system CheB/CheR fusion protein